MTHFIPLPLSGITMALNILLLIIGFIFCGKEFGAKTVYTSVMLPVFLGIFRKSSRILRPHRKSELDAVCYVLVVSIGPRDALYMNASSGGLDIVAKIMNKYLHVDLGKAMSLSGMCVALSSAFVYDKKTVVLSVLGTYVNGIVLDYFIFDQNVKRRVRIITKKEKELREFIINNSAAAQRSMKRSGAYNL
ncbi:MAG: YitT family protein [Clostridium sp.]